MRGVVGVALVAVAAYASGRRQGKLEGAWSFLQLQIERTRAEVLANGGRR